MNDRSSFTIETILERNEVDFHITTLQREAAQLERERAHLNSKALERPLTLWEYTRLDKIFEEMSATMKQMAKLALHKRTEL